ncbi:MAG: hypothetical protein JNK82_37685 [Myxococcaceae bacterium]|nr:hypothetical protein [Myxococcaceae bacterium]
MRALALTLSLAACTETPKPAPIDPVAVMRQVQRAFRPTSTGAALVQPGFRVDVANDGTKTLSTGSSRWRWSAPQLSRGGRGLPAKQPTLDVAHDGSLAVRWGPATETLKSSGPGFEHTFVLQSAPEGTGPLTIRVPVEGLDARERTQSGLHFAAPETNLGFAYGEGTWVDARGKRTPVRVRHDRGALTLEVDAATLAGTTWPAVLDPQVSPELGLDNPVYGPEQTEQSEPNIAATNDTFLVGWLDARNDSSSVFVARVSKSGELLDPTGLEIARNAGAYALAANGTTFLVTYTQRTEVDFRYRYSVRATRLTSSGGVLDVPAIELDEDASMRHVAATAQGPGFAVAYLRTNGTTYPVEVAQLDLTGTVNAVGSAGVSGAATAPALATNGTEVLIVWGEAQSLSGSSRLMARRLSAAGEWTGAAFSIGYASNIGYSRAAASATFGAQQYLVAWNGRGADAGAIVAGTRIDPAGSVSDNPPIVISGGPAGLNPSVTFDGTDYRVLWARSDGFPRYTLMSSRVSAFGVAQQTATIGAVQNADEHALASASGQLMLAWKYDGPASGVQNDIAGSLLDSNGAMPDAGFFVSRAANLQETPSVAWDGRQYLVTWADYRSRDGDTDIWGARVDPSGAVLDPSGLEISSSPRPERGPRVAGSPNGFIVAWEEVTALNLLDVRARRLGADGRFIDTTPFALFGGGAGQSAPAVTWNGNEYLALWRYVSTTASGIAMRRIGPPDAGAFLIATGNLSAPALASLGNGESFAVWLRSDTRDVFGTRIDAAGRALDRDGGTPVSTAAPVPGPPVIATDGQRYFVAWSGVLNGDGPPQHRIFGARVDPQALTLDPVPFVLSPDAGSAQAPTLAFDGTRYVVVWQEADGRIYGSEFEPNGTVVGTPGARLSNEGRNPQLAFGAGGSGLLVYDRYAAASDLRTRRVRGALISRGFAPVPPDPVTPIGATGGGNGGAGGGNGNGEDEPRGCGCTTSGPVSLSLLALALLRRRVTSSRTAAARWLQIFADLG